jgi:putative ABC transport system permease protein
MDNLVVSNLFYRKTRTVTTMIGVALGVVLVVLTVGIAHGFLHDQGRRNAAVTAEIIMGPPGSTFGLSLNPTLSLPLDLAGQIQSIDGVRDVVPVGQYLSGHVIDGIEFESFKKVSEIKVVEGRPPQSGDETIIDRIQQKRNKLKVGDQMEIFDRPFRIVGIFEPESLARIKVPLATMQQFLNRPLCSMLLVKLSDPTRQEEVASKFWIAGEIEKEALLISALGVVAGSALAIAGKFAITRLTPISVELEPLWLFYAFGLGLLAGALGALYPALRAANQDPVTALAYE